LARIPEQIVEQVRHRADLVEVVGRYVGLKKSGSGFMGLCPFHTERTPSFHVHPDKQVFYCFGCHEGGDVFGFLMRHDQLSFPDAIRALAQQAGVEIPETGDDGSRLAPLYRVNEQARAFFRQSLRSAAGREARAYLERRGVPQDLIDRFQIGFAPPGWESLATEISRQRQPLRVAVEAGVLGERRNGDGHYDRFRDRIVFPIVEPGGRVTGFGARSLGSDEPKYLNSPDSPIYHKGQVLFGLNLATDAMRKAGRAVLVEGYFDLIALHRAGINCGVAPCGTALTAEHARRLRRYTREVVLLFDGDEAGQRAAERALPVLAAEGLRVLGAFLPPGADPDSLIAEGGEAALRACVESARPLLDYMIERQLMASSQHAWESADRARDLAPLLAAIPDAVERDSYVRDIASQLELTVGAVEKALRAATTTRPTPRRQDEPEPARIEPAKLDPITRTLIDALCTHSALVDLVESLDAASMPPGQGAALLVTLCRAVREHGDGAVTHLLSPSADGLPPELMGALAEINASVHPVSRELAERAVNDCIVRLKREGLERESTQIDGRLESCTDAAEKDALLERRQQIAAERSELWNQVHHM
jgi:DNA primase